MQEQLENTLARLIAIPSESMDNVACREIIEYVRSELEPLGVHIGGDASSQHPWLIATTQPTKTPKILLVAHLDVVPAVEDSQYELRKDERKLYGRGVWDMKYAAAGFIELFKNQREQLPALDIGVLFTTDEEIGGYQGVREVLRQGWRTELAFIPDYGDEWRIEEKAKGLYSCKLFTEGRSAHGSRPWEGDNAVQKLIPVLHELQTMYSSADHLGPTLSINMLEGGEAMNQIADNASAWLDFRAFEVQEIAEYKALLQRLTKEYNFQYEETVTGHPLTLDKNHPLVKAYLSTLEAHGITPKYEKSFGATDGRWFAEYDIPCIVTGPHGFGAHGGEEWVARQDLVTFYHLLEHFVANNAPFKTLGEAPALAHTANFYSEVFRR